MKFCTFQKQNGEKRSGWLEGEGSVADMHQVSNGTLPKTMIEFLENGVSNLKLAREYASNLRHEGKNERQTGIYCLEEVKLCSPLPRPASIRDFYAFESHVKTARARRGLEMIPEWYHFPVFYFSNHQAVVGPEEFVSVPPGCNWLDYELEMACVIGRRGADIATDEAEAYIFGYCVMNDWSARDVQREEVKVGLGPAKGKDFATSLGPYLVTPDELTPYRHGDRYHLEMTASVNGNVLSKGNYSDIYFPFPALIERASAGVTLHPGDVFGTGTVGTGCILELGTEVHPWLMPGDIVELSIQGLGTLRNTITS